MITIKWSHVIIGLALVIGLLIGSHVQFTPSSALAQSASPIGQFYTTNSTPPVAMQVYNNNVYIVRGNNLFIFKTVESPFFKDRKFPVMIGRTVIDLDTTTTNNVVPSYVAPNREAPANPTLRPGQPLLR